MRIPDHTRSHRRRGALARWVESDEFDPSATDFQDATPLRRIVAADEALAEARAHLDNEVRAPPSAGLSWTTIGAVLGISRQAARQRFGSHAHT